MDRSKVQRLGERWAAAERSGDAGVLADVLTDDFVGVGPAGFVLTKDEWIARHRTGDLRYDRLAWQDVDVRTHADTAIAVGVQEQHGTYQQQRVDGRFRATQVCVRRDDGWAILAMQLSPMRGEA